MKILFFLDSEMRPGPGFFPAIRNIVPADIVVCTESELKSELADAEIFASFGSIFPREILGAKRLRWIHSFSAGVDRFLIPELIDSGILLTNSSGVHPIQIGEHVFGMLLAFERGIIASERNRRIGKWDRSINASEIYGRTVCIVGAGRIGERIAALAMAFGCEVTGVSRSGSPAENFRAFPKERIADAVTDADYIINILPHTKETEGIFSGLLFGRMKKSAVYCSVGRGKTTVESDLIKALQDRTIRGACLDVFETEPLPESSPLWKMDNVLISPHVAGKTPRYMERAEKIFVGNLKAYCTGQRMPNLVDKNAGY